MALSTEFLNFLSQGVVDNKIGVGECWISLAHLLFCYSLLL